MRWVDKQKQDWEAKGEFNLMTGFNMVIKVQNKTYTKSWDSKGK